MPNRIVAGLVAGAAGTVALNVTTYLDMLVRGRPPSKLPAQVAGALAEEIGLPLDFDVSDADDGNDDGDSAASDADRLANRREAVGALLGYANGAGIGLAYGVSRFVLPRMPLWLAGVALGSAAMAASDVPATRLGLTDPGTWRPVDWAADVVPHLVYGLVTALSFEALRR
jgi:hypothetical protein